VKVETGEETFFLQSNLGCHPIPQFFLFLRLLLSVLASANILCLETALTLLAVTHSGPSTLIISSLSF